MPHKMMNALLMFLSFLCLTYSMSNDTYLKLEGSFARTENVPHEESSQTLKEITHSMSTSLEILCALHCIDDLRCNAIEICNVQMGNKICRLSTKVKQANQSYTGPVCKRFQMDGMCYGGYFDRVDSECIYNCQECECVRNNIASVGGSRIIQSDIYSIFGAEESFHVYCSFSDQHAWTVIQRRYDGTVDFNRSWNDYRNGFGFLETEFWLGLEHIFQLTSDGPKVLRIDLEGIIGEEVYAEYGNFYIEDVNENYRLHVSDYSGTAGDSMTSAGGMEFSTYDNDHDSHETLNCAQWYPGGWWHNACQISNLNGKYGSNSYGKGINWKTFYPLTVSLKSSEMKIRKKHL